MTKTKKPSVAMKSAGETVDIYHDSLHVGSVSLSDIHVDVVDHVMVKGVAAILGAATNAAGVAARIEALKAGQTTTRVAKAEKPAKPHSAAVRAIGLANADIDAKMQDIDVTPALVALHTREAAELSKTEKKAAFKRRDVLTHHAALVGV
jgi:hypothetical protein